MVGGCPSRPGASRRSSGGALLAASGCLSDAAAEATISGAWGAWLDQSFERH